MDVTMDEAHAELARPSYAVLESTVGLSISGCSGSSSSNQQATLPVDGQKRRGGRRPREDDQQMTPEQAAKRARKRLMNREAAARFRSNQAQDMVYLMHNIRLEQDRQNQLDGEVNDLNITRQGMQLMLEEHTAICPFMLINGNQQQQRQQQQQMMMTMTPQAVVGMPGPHTPTAVPVQRNYNAQVAPNNIIYMALEMAGINPESPTRLTE